MSYFVDCAWYSWLRGSLLSGITWTQWTAYCLIIILLVFLSQFPPPCQCTHTNVSKTMCVFFLSIPPVGENAAGCLGWNVSPCGDSRVYLTARCGVADVTFVGICTCVCVCVCERTCFSVHPCLYVKAKASLCLWQQGCTYITVCPHRCEVTFMRE